MTMTQMCFWPAPAKEREEPHPSPAREIPRPDFYTVRHGFPRVCPITGRNDHCARDCQPCQYHACADIGQWLCLHPTWQDAAPRCACGNPLSESWDGVERRLVADGDLCVRCWKARLCLTP